MTKILVIRFSALGDTALLVPVVRYWAERHPDTEVTILSRQQYAGLFLDLPANVRFAGADLKGRHRGRKGLDLLLEDIDLRQFDAVADMHGVWRSRYLTLRMALRGIPTATIRKDRIQRFLLTHGLRHKPLRPVWQRYADVFERLTADKGMRKMCSSMPKATDRENSNEIGIAPFAAHKGKQYPIEKTEEVVRCLTEQGYSVLLFGGGDEERTVLHRLAERYENTRSVPDMQLSLREEMALMKDIRLMISMDSANMHLASLVGTRVVSVWGATHPMTGFLGYGQSIDDCVQRNLPCRPCSIYGNKKCRYGDWHCLDIAPEEIVANVSERSLVAIVKRITTLDS